MVLTEKFKIGLKDIGKNNEIKNVAILEFLEDIGGRHSDLAGYGVNDIVTTHLAWILLDWKLEIINRPKYGQELTIKTWGRDINKVFSYRDFEIYNENNDLCVIATSKWAVIDVRYKKLAKLTDEIMKKYQVEDKRLFKEKDIKRISIPENFERSIDYTVTRKDIDLNGHMHNLYYIDLAYEALPEEVYEKRPFDNVVINYKKEIKPNDKVECKYTKIDNKHIVVIKNKKEEKVHAVIELF